MQFFFSSSKKGRGGGGLNGAFHLLGSPFRETANKLADSNSTSRLGRDFTVPPQALNQVLGVRVDPLCPPHRSIFLSLGKAGIRMPSPHIYNSIVHESCYLH